MAEITMNENMFYECPKCGGDIELGQRYCQECGEPLEWKVAGTKDESNFRESEERRFV